MWGKSSAPLHCIWHIKFWNLQSLHSQQIEEEITSWWPEHVKKRGEKKTGKVLSFFFLILNILKLTLDCLRSTNQQELLLLRTADTRTHLYHCKFSLWLEIMGNHQCRGITKVFPCKIQCFRARSLLQHENKDVLLRLSAENLPASFSVVFSLAWCQTWLNVKKNNKKPKNHCVQFRAEITSNWSQDKIVHSSLILFFHFLPYFFLLLYFSMVCFLRKHSVKEESLVNTKYFSMTATQQLLV